MNRVSRRFAGLAGTRRFALASLGSIALLPALGATPEVRQTAAGLSVRLSAGWVALAAEGTSALRLSVATDGEVQPVQSVFLAPDRPKPVWHRVDAPPFVGIATSAGSLLLDPTAGQWELKDAGGHIVVPPSALFATTAGDGNVHLGVAWPAEKAVYVYGSGNGQNALRQTDGATRVGNGRAVVPYYWSDVGYSVLAVTRDDAHPAAWKTDAAGHGIVWTFPGAQADLYLMPAANLEVAARSYGELGGRPPVPPRWTFGYLQSRWGWVDRPYIEQTLQEFRQRHLPLDAFIFDFEWYTPRPDYTLPPEGVPDFPDFGWNALLFPDPKHQLAEYRRQGVRFVGIRKPRLGDDASLRMMREKGWSLFPYVPEPPPPPDAKTPPKRNYHARDMDFRNPAFAAWYEEHTRPLVEAGVDGWWNDEGEASFLTYYFWNAAEVAVARQVAPDKRFWSLNRAFQPGLQRLGAAAWTGDIHTTWEDLQGTPTSLLNWGLAGMPFSACDIGGFNETPSPELLVRWMEAGVFFPIMRSHSTRTATPHFPWLYGDDAEQAMREALNLRYRLIPLLYTLAHETYATGVPIMRPLAMVFPDDPKAAEISDQWCIGSRLMVAPQLQPGGRRTVYLPAGQWYRLGSSEPLAGGRSIDVTSRLDEIPIFVRAGTILPLGPVLQSTADSTGDRLVLEIYPGANADTQLIDDDGETNAYTRGDVRRTTFTWNQTRRELTWKTTGSYAGPQHFGGYQAHVLEPGATLTRDLPPAAEGRIALSP